MASSSRKVYILTNGCPENRIDSSKIQAFFGSNGYEISKKVGDADLIIFNACALTQTTEDSSLRIIEEIKEAKASSAELIVCGCLTKINPDRLKQVYQGPVFGSDELTKLDEIIKPNIASEQIYANSLISATGYLNRYRWFLRNFRGMGTGIIIKILERMRQRQNAAASICRQNMFCIKICSGCLGNCSFCAIRLSRGGLKSKPFETVIKEFEEGLTKGYKDFALLGTEVGAYGKDLGIDLVVLLKELISRKGDYRISLRNLHPRNLIEMLPELCKVFGSGRIPYVACSPESGNNRILGLMNRGYNIEDFKEAILTLNHEFPQIKIRTQLMVGFPTETEEEFQDSMRLVDGLHFDFVEVYIFEARKGTRAAAMTGQVPEKIKQERYFKLLTLLLRKKC
jgi:MiaB/RimO family radical SAM methylthiotransferase